MKKKLIIDTDCGSDDAIAIAIALKDNNFDIKAFTIVSGNVEAKQAAKNTLTTLEYVDKYYPPVYMGADKMLLKELVYAHETHGNDGMGDLGFCPKKGEIAEGNAIIKMLEMLNTGQDKEYDVIALGPLTNIAIALRLDYQAMSKIDNLVIMGSSGLGWGNVSPVAEFNIWQDAEAAKIVLESGLEKIILVGWDACLGDSMLNKEELDKLKLSGELGAFLVDSNRVLIDMNKKRFGFVCLDMADPAAMVAALKPEIISEMDKYYCEVDVSTGPSYGSVLVDYNHFSGKEENVYVCSKLKSNEYKKYVLDTLLR